jgi:DNA-binding LacI/PurR family transcriptional regulator
MVKKRRARMEDVAQAAGVSRTAVSFVLNDIADANIPESTRQRILQAARELNYTPNAQALNLVRGKTMLVALVVRQTSEQMSADAFLGEIIRGITRIIEAEDYHLVVHAVEPGVPNKTTYGELIRTHKVDGLLITSPLINDPEVKVLHDEGTPIVLNGAADFNDIPSVDVDNVQGAYTAVRHLIDLGHRRIAHISNAPFSYTSARDRLTGYQQALAEAGIDYDDQLIHPGAFTDVSSYEPMMSLLDLFEPPTAVFIGSDLVALGAVQAVHDRGLRIPKDISIIGFDDLFISKYLQPPLTTIHLPAYDLGQRLGEMILTSIRGETFPTLRALLPTELVIRQSTRQLSV